MQDRFGDRSYQLVALATKHRERAATAALSRVRLKSLRYGPMDVDVKASRCSEGFSLTVLMVVLAIVAVMMAAALPTMPGAERRAQDTAAQATLVAAPKTEEVFGTDDATYSSSGANLSALEPSLDRSGTTDASVHIAVATVVTANDSVLLYTLFNSGTWFGLRHVGSGAGAGRHECLGAARAEVDHLADCVGHDW